MACFLHGQHGLVGEVPYRPVQTIVRSLSSLFKLVPCAAEPPFPSLPPTLCSFFPSLSPGLVVLIRNKWLYNKSARRRGLPRSLGLWVELANVAHREYTLPVWAGSSSRIAGAQFHSSRGSNPSCALQMDNRNPVLADYRSTALPPTKDFPLSNIYAHQHPPLYPNLSSYGIDSSLPVQHSIS